MDYMLGGTSAMCAGFFSNPFDVIKTRQQLQGELQNQKLSNQPYGGVIRSFKSIIKAEGIKGLQKGLGPALSFQFVLNSSRLGFYQTIEDLHWTKFKKSDKVRSPILCIFWGGVAGVLGSVLGSPFYLIKTQIQSQSIGKYAVGYQHHHKSTIQALVLIAKSHGIKGLWRGASGLIPRTAVASSAQLGSFTVCKDILLKYEIFQSSVILTATVASFTGGCFTAICMTPFDVISTRLFNQGVDSNGRGLLYKNIFDCFWKTFKIEGIRGLYKGIMPNYMRLAPHSILNLTFWEQFKKWKNMYLVEECSIIID